MGLDLVNLVAVLVVTLCAELSQAQSGDGNCGAPPTLANADWKAVDGTYAAGTEFVYKCQENFYPTAESGDGIFQCDASTLTWKGGTFICSAADRCTSSPCQFGGTCETDTTRSVGYRCVCQPSYTGEFCQTSQAGDPVIFFVIIRSMVDYTPDMNDTNSGAFALIGTKQEIQIGLLFSHIVTSDGTTTDRSKYFQGIALINITRGSIITNSIASFDPTVPDTAPQLQARLRTAVTQLKVDNPNDPLYDIDTSYVFVNSGPDPDTSTTTTTNLLPVWIIIGLLALLILILLILILIWRRRRRKRIRDYSERSRREEDDESYGLQYYPTRNGGYRWPNKRTYFWRDYPADFNGDLAQSTLGPVEFVEQRQTVRAVPYERNLGYDWATVGRGGGINMLSGGGQVGNSWRYASGNYF